MLKIILLQDWAIESILSVEDTLKKLDFDFMLFFTQHRDVLFLNYFRWQFLVCVFFNVFFNYGQQIV